jgi:hypothetical protein
LALLAQLSATLGQLRQADCFGLIRVEQVLIGTGDPVQP